MDFYLIHAPSVYDFRKRSLLYGPISDVVPSTPVFEMYPLGFVSLMGYLERHGYRVKIINLAVKMLKDPSFNAESLIKKLYPLAFGIDLHWLVHAQGALEVAKIIKRHHPDTPIILGGLSATYYHEEVMANHPEVDFIVRGDSAEQPLYNLLKSIEKGMEPLEVPNLTWRDKQGTIKVNPLSYVPEDLNDYSLNYEVIVKSVLREADLESNLPFKSWAEYPYTAVITCKGCIYNCVTCGGSRYAYERFFNRPRPVFKDPAKLIEELRIIGSYVKAPTFILGDLRMAGDTYVESFIRLLKRERIDNPMVFELFTIASERFLKELLSATSELYMEISPESHDEEVRCLQGRFFTNQQLEKMIEKALTIGVKRLDVFFMIGLRKQNLTSTLKTVEYCDHLLEKYGKEDLLHPFIAPLAPFLDPGSLAFENPSNYGYSVSSKSFEHHRRLLEGLTWKHYLNYETTWLSKEELVEATYQSSAALTLVKLKHGLLSRKEAEELIDRIKLNRQILRKLDQILSEIAPDQQPLTLEGLRSELQKANEPLLCLKEELRPPFKARLKPLSILKLLLRRIF
ncbi:MAG: TIGR04190 family B12-binding domain/radical SAM domain protein [Candidatus Nezhaarchaeales archaeon]